MSIVVSGRHDDLRGDYVGRLQAFLDLAAAGVPAARPAAASAAPPLPALRRDSSERAVWRRLPRLRGTDPPPAPLNQPLFSFLPCTAELYVHPKSIDQLLGARGDHRRRVGPRRVHFGRSPPRAPRPAPRAPRPPRGG